MKQASSIICTHKTLLNETVVFEWCCSNCLIIIGRGSKYVARGLTPRNSNYRKERHLLMKYSKTKKNHDLPKVFVREERFVFVHDVVN